SKKATDEAAVTRKWRQHDIIAKSQRADVWPEWLGEDREPEDFFELFFDVEVISLIADQSIKYAVEKGQTQFIISENEFKIFLAILLISGYCCYPRRRMYWECAADVHQAGIANAMSRNRFEEILRFFHVCDNSNLDQSDKFAKIRPLWSLLNSRWLKWFPGDGNLSVDESMCPYFGRHSCKQHIHGKPISFGYKIWCLYTRLGYIIQGIPYQGDSTGNTYPDIGVGGSVVLNLVEALPSKHHLHFDNFFTSLKLLDSLQKKGHDGTGTIRANREEHAPLKNPKVMKNCKRGEYHQVTDVNSKITLVRYNDNNVVTVGSTFCGVQPIGQCKRWSKAEKKRITIDQPRCIVQYNENMGGVDRMDQNIASYRIGIRSKKWYWPLIGYAINTCVNNAWKLYRLTEQGKRDGLDLLGFTRRIVQTYLAKHALERQRPGRAPVPVKRRVENA
ncbi:piggyBac transposable element-derived protein 3-like, partial [Belonocnema kinseyi]|uniref:piggyBac transposable element-derived protein 3-like n=1 Tax=Belonocnema kinseyi TaxID=2817044 RepID=UPI00143D6800